MQKRKPAKVSSSDGRAFVLGLVSAIIVMVLMLIASAICIANEYLTLDAFQIISYLIQFICVFAGSFVAGTIVKENKERMALIVGAIVYLLQLCSAMLFFDALNNTFWVNLLIAAIGIISSMLILRRQKSKTRGRAVSKRR